MLVRRCRRIFPTWRGLAGLVERATGTKRQQVAHRLDLLLEESLSLSESQPLSREGLSQLGGELVDATQKLETELTALLRPFQSESLRGLVRECESRSDRPRPQLAEEIESILATPFPAAADRARLWKAAQVLDRRLGDLDFDTPGSINDSTATKADRKEVVRELAARRVDRLAALLQLAGPAAAGDQRGASVDLGR